MGDHPPGSFGCDDENMKIVVGITGGIAAYKTVHLVRLMVKAGHTVTVVPTENALEFVGKPTWEALSRNPVTTSVHEDVPEVRHVRLGQEADLIVVAPATANTLAKMAAGIADDLLGTTLIASKAPVLVAPAMHTEMWQHASTQANVHTLRERGVHFVGPEAGELTGTDSGLGRMTEPEQIFERAMAFSSVAQDLTGCRVLVTAGGTREPIDPVRFIGNRSSGRQGIEVAAEAARRGAAVTLIAANIEQRLLEGLASSIEVSRVGSTAELEAAVHLLAASADAIVMAAAVSDYRVAEVADGKLRKADQGESLHLNLVENPDILRGLVDARGSSNLAKPVLVGFAAETVASDEELLERGRAKLARKGCDLLAVNAVGWSQGFEKEHNHLWLLEAGGSLVGQAEGSKGETARVLVDALVPLIEGPEA